jgi:hypothetical protein
MPRKDYTNYPPTEERQSALKRLAKKLGLDPSKHADRVTMLDEGLRAAINGMNLVGHQCDVANRDVWVEVGGTCKYCGWEVPS